METLLAQLYGAVALDPAAREFVERQTRDRHAHLEKLAGRKALPVLALLTRFETYLELRRRAGLTQRQTVSSLQHIAAQVL